MSPSALLLCLIPIGYVLGSIPFGLIVGLAKGIDPRTAGSGNIGATNVGRLLGRRFFFLVFFLDLLKSFLPMLIASYLVHRIPPAERNWLVYLEWLGVGAAAVFGHMFSLFLGFKGGKGVSASAGVMLGLIPYYTLPGILGVGVFLTVLKTTRYVSLASMIGAASFPIFYLAIGLAMGWPVLGSQLPLLVFGAVMVMLIIYRHRTNISRLRAGTESRVGSKAA
ncbi:MAG: glycerol-3-phosphate 1-O-acyltransferase PlsY [Phycisphaerae bacterium]|nr:glycerol-3-phosphate 1-O-acyltransferase PlsY [Phycisphaerae bacterium]